MGSHLLIHSQAPARSLPVAFATMKAGASIMSSRSIFDRSRGAIILPGAVDRANTDRTSNLAWFRSNVQQLVEESEFAPHLDTCSWLSSDLLHYCVPWPCWAARFRSPPPSTAHLRRSRPPHLHIVRSALIAIYFFLPSVLSIAATTVPYAPSPILSKI